jgi:hypothetical protein
MIDFDRLNGGEIRMSVAMTDVEKDWGPLIFAFLSFGTSEFFPLCSDSDHCFYRFILIAFSAVQYLRFDYFVFSSISGPTLGPFISPPTRSAIITIAASAQHAVKMKNPLFDGRSAIREPTWRGMQFGNRTTGLNHRF